MNGVSEETINALLATTKGYIEMLEKNIEYLKKMKSDDRLGYASHITFCLNALMVSIKGWSSWMNHIETLATLSLEDLQQCFPIMRDLTVKFLELDVEITRKKLGEAEVKMKVGRPQKKGTYVT